ncbi:Peptidyl-prolyl cis-trans isomerase cyp10 [Sporothrix stenoceras]|uniref:Peptidyl-prolyl cis-trans isomerase n=1 Tax=Sporothrix stenoceras TaxID=5173 RepID=A0ABR3Z477_9PEZI
MSVTLHTNVGDLKIEVFCESVPKTAENFLALCASGYYDGSPFHRVVAGFMAQTGMPASASEKSKDKSKEKDKGTSIWGQPFEDEIRMPALRHHARGIVSMANKGAPPVGSGLSGTNGSQFFVTFARTPHLDGVNTVFGRLLGEASFETLDKIEACPVDKKHRPKSGPPPAKGEEGESSSSSSSEPPKIVRVTVHANPLAK